jgi:hypothetical protein
MTQVGEILLKGLIFLVMAAVALSAVLFAVGETVEHFTPHPTPDQLYGCTVEQQAPNGECR